MNPCSVAGGQAELDVLCRHTGLVEVARGLAGMQESLYGCKKAQEGTVLSVFLVFPFSAFQPLSTEQIFSTAGVETV